MTGKLLRVYPEHIVLDNCGMPSRVMRHTLNKLLREYRYRVKILQGFWGWKIRTTARRPIVWPRRQQTAIIPRDQL